MEKITSTELFERFIADNPTAIVKFFTDWCVDCSRIDKGFGEYAEANKDRAAFAEINADDVNEIASRYDVRGIPSLLVFRSGQLTERLYSRDAKTVKQVVEFAEKVL